jgi:fucose 4-O-acetylase-like acetyltransferase
MASSPARDPWPDNAKLVLIVLVAIGHLLSKGITDRLPEAHALYVWIYLFHMPAFVFLAGFFSGGRELSARSLRGIVTRLLVPYLVFTVLYSVAVSAVGDEGLQVDLVNPY